MIQRRGYAGGIPNTREHQGVLLPHGADNGGGAASLSCPTSPHRRSQPLRSVRVFSLASLSRGFVEPVVRACAIIAGGWVGGLVNYEKDRDNKTVFFVFIFLGRERFFFSFSFSEDCGSIREKL